MKKITAILIAIILLITLAACGDDGEENTTTAEANTTTEITSETTTETEVTTTTAEGFVSKKAEELYKSLTNNEEGAYEKAVEYIKQIDPSTTYKGGYDAVLWNLTKEIDLMLVKQSRALYLRKYDEQDIKLYNNIDYNTDEITYSSFLEGKRMNECVIGNLYYKEGYFYHLGEIVYKIPYGSEICGYSESPTYKYIVFVHGQEVVLLTVDNNIFTETLLSNQMSWSSQVSVHGRSVIFIDDFDRVIQIDIMDDAIKSSVICNEAYELNSYGEYETAEGVLTPKYYITAEGEKTSWGWYLG